MDDQAAKGQNVRENTSSLNNLMIDEQTFKNIRRSVEESDQDISQRIRELDEEWDIERVLDINLSTIALTGIGLAVFRNHRWLALPTLALGFFAQQAIQGWSPPVKFLRFLKVRTRDEIDQEKHALKAIRGDYADLHSTEEAFMAARANE